MKKARMPISYMLNKKRGGKGTTLRNGKFLGKSRGKR